jgi:hypothetical protein
MPIEFGFTPFGESDETDASMIQPGDGIFLADHSNGKEQILAITCEEDDSAGNVKIVHRDDLVTTEDKEGGFEVVELPEPIEDIEIAEGSPHEREYVALGEEGGALVPGILEIRWVPGDEVTPNFNIPIGLIYPQ